MNINIIKENKNIKMSNFFRRTKKRITLNKKNSRKNIFFGGSSLKMNIDKKKKIKTNKKEIKEEEIKKIDIYEQKKDKVSSEIVEEQTKLLIDSKKDIFEIECDVISYGEIEYLLDNNNNNIYSKPDNEDKYYLVGVKVDDYIKFDSKYEKFLEIKEKYNTENNL
jgi:hypothetical protein